jgi:hypothetical protein
MVVIPAVWEDEIGRTAVSGQPRQKHLGNLSHQNKVG